MCPFKFSPTAPLKLNCLPLISRDNGLMVVLYIVLLPLTIIRNRPLFKIIRDICFLK